MSKTIMIVEDNDLNLKLFNDILETQGYNIITASDGLKAFSLARQNHLDLIIMDIQLPEVSGLEVTKWIKEDNELKHIPVIAVTAFAMREDEKKILDGGCDAYIAKPISISPFLETVKRLLETDAESKT